MRQLHLILLLLFFLAANQTISQAEPSLTTDWRNIRNGHVIPDEGYCDQPYIVQTQAGHWLCTLTTGKGKEGDPGQHVVATISKNRGKTWGDLIDIEPDTGPEASWVIPAVMPYGRVYAFYDYNGDRITGRRADMLGWYVFKYSDDHGRTWSDKRYRLPVRRTACDQNNGFEDGTQIFWGIDKPIIAHNNLMFAFTKLGKYMLDQGEGWFFQSSNILHERDPNKIQWEMLPEGDHGLRADRFGSVQEEHNIVALDDGTLYCMYRTTTGHPCHAYSTDGGETWTKPQYATYTPGGRTFKHNRACPAMWKCNNGKYLFWFNHRGDKTYQNRNPVWLCGGEEIGGKIHWSQPEILFYDPDPEIRISYPDLIEEDGRYWISQTQKSIARVCEVDADLLNGLWNQGKRQSIIKNGLIFEQKTIANKEISFPELPDLSQGGGFSLDFQFKLDSTKPNQVFVDTMDQKRGLQIQTVKNRALEVTFSDGKHTCRWSSDPGLLNLNQWHHISIIVDGGPKIVSFVIDGIVCDGGKERIKGWTRFPDAMGSVNGKRNIKISSGIAGSIRQFRIYDRYLRTSEAIANYHALIEK